MNTMSTLPQFDAIFNTYAQVAPASPEEEATNNDNSYIESGDTVFNSFPKRSKLRSGLQSAYSYYAAELPVTGTQTPEMLRALKEMWGRLVEHPELSMHSRFWAKLRSNGISLNSPPLRKFLTEHTGARYLSAEKTRALISASLSSKNVIAQKQRLDSAQVVFPHCSSTKNTTMFFSTLSKKNELIPTPLKSNLVNKAEAASVGRFLRLYHACVTTDKQMPVYDVLGQVDTTKILVDLFNNTIISGGTQNGMVSRIVAYPYDSIREPAFLPKWAKKTKAGPVRIDALAGIVLHSLFKFDGPAVPTYSLGSFEEWFENNGVDPTAGMGSPFFTHAGGLLKPGDTIYLPDNIPMYNPKANKGAGGVVYVPVADLADALSFERDQHGNRTTVLDYVLFYMKMLFASDLTPSQVSNFITQDPVMSKALITAMRNKVEPIAFEKVDKKVRPYGATSKCISLPAQFAFSTSLVKDYENRALAIGIDLATTDGCCKFMNWLTKAGPAALWIYGDDTIVRGALDHDIDWTNANGSLEDAQGILAEIAANTVAFDVSSCDYSHSHFNAILAGALLRRATYNSNAPSNAQKLFAPFVEAFMASTYGGPVTLEQYREFMKKSRGKHSVQAFEELGKASRGNGQFLMGQSRLQHTRGMFSGNPLTGELNAMALMTDYIMFYIHKHLEPGFYKNKEATPVCLVEFYNSCASPVEFNAHIAQNLVDHADEFIDWVKSNVGRQYKLSPVPDFLSQSLYVCTTKLPDQTTQHFVFPSLKPERFLRSLLFTATGKYKNLANTGKAISMFYVTKSVFPFVSELCRQLAVESGSILSPTDPDLFNLHGNVVSVTNQMSTLRQNLALLYLSDLTTEMYHRGDQHDSDTYDSEVRRALVNAYSFGYMMVYPLLGNWPSTKSYAEYLGRQGAQQIADKPAVHAYEDPSTSEDDDDDEEEALTLRGEDFRPVVRKPASDDSSSESDDEEEELLLALQPNADYDGKHEKKEEPTADDFFYDEDDLPEALPMTIDVPPAKLPVGDPNVVKVKEDKPSKARKGTEVLVESRKYNVRTLANMPAGKMVTEILLLVKDGVRYRSLMRELIMYQDSAKHYSKMREVNKKAAKSNGNLVEASKRVDAFIDTMVGGLR